MGYLNVVTNVLLANFFTCKWQSSVKSEQLGRVVHWGGYQEYNNCAFKCKTPFYSSARFYQGASFMPFLSITGHNNVLFVFIGQCDWLFM